MQIRGAIIQRPYIPRSVYYCLRYITESLTNAHTSPTAQYTLVSISGKNAIADGSTAASAGAQWSPAAHSVALCTAEDVRDEVTRGKRVTKAWRRAKPAMYARSSVSRTTQGSDVGNLRERRERHSDYIE